jgi:hypothetical protein
MIEVQKSTLDMAGQSRLDQIRAGMSGGGQLPASSPQQAIDPATPGSAQRTEGETS